MKTRLVAKLSLVLMALLAIILYKTNDYFKDEKIGLAQLQVHNRIINLKTSIAGQLAQLRNVLSSYETEVNEAKINWVQLAPFYVLAQGQVDASGRSLKITSIYTRSGSSAQNWNKDYLQKALNLDSMNYQPDTVTQLFRDRSGGKFMALNFRVRGRSRLVVVGPTDYFQKYFDLDRGGRYTTGLLTDSNIIAAHSESDYVASLSDEKKISYQKYLAEFEDIAGTNLTVMTYALKKNITQGFSVPWSVIGLIVGFGFVFMAILSYGLEPIEKRIERYRMEEKKTIFEKTLGDLSETVTAAIATEVDQPTDTVASEKPEEVIVQTVSDPIVVDTPLDPLPGLKERIELKARELIPSDEEKNEATLIGPLQQAIFNMDRKLKQAKISVHKSITSNQTYMLPYKTLTRAFEELLQLIIDATPDRQSSDQKVKSLTIHLSDNYQLGSVTEFIGSTWGEITINPQQMSGLFQKIGGEIIFEKDAQGFKISYLMAREKQAVMQLKEKMQDEVNNSTVIINESEEDRDSQIALNVLKNSEMQNHDILEDNTEMELDLDQILSLEESSEEFKPIHTKVIDEKTVIDQTENQLASKQVMQFQAPQIHLSKKHYGVDDLEVSVRRPEKC